MLRCLVSTGHPRAAITSGTTGSPKGALLPCRKVIYNSLNAEIYFNIRCDDRVLIVAPLFHSLALQILALPIMRAGGALLLQKRFRPELVWDAVDQFGITYFGGVPAMHQAHGGDADAAKARWQQVSSAINRPDRLNTLREGLLNAGRALFGS